MAKRKRRAAKRAKPATKNIARQGRAIWETATVTASDRASRYGGRAEAEELLSFVRSWVGVCIQTNASVCSSFPIRLFRVKQTRSTRSRSIDATTRPVSDRRLKAFLADRARNGLGWKSALYAEQAGDVEEVLYAPPLDLLHRPSLDLTISGADLFYSAFEFLEAVGNAFWFVVRGDSGLPTELLPCFPQWVTIVPSVQGLVAGYIYQRPGGDQAWVEADDMLHRKHRQSMRSPYLGSSPLHYVMDEAAILEAANINEIAKFENNARPDLVVKVHDDTTDDQLERIRASFRSMHEGPGNAGKAFFTNHEVIPLSVNARESEFLEGRKYNQQTILAAYEIPESEVRLNDANLASSLMGNAQYLRRAIRPRLCRMAEFLTERYLPMFGLEPGEYFFSYGEIVPEDRQFARDSAVTFVANGIWNRNEARQELGYDPIPGELGDLYTVNGIPLGQTPQPVALPMPGAPQSPVSIAPSLSKAAPDLRAQTGETKADSPTDTKADDPLPFADLDLDKLTARVEEALKTADFGPDGLANEAEFKGRLEEALTPTLERFFSTGRTEGFGQIAELDGGQQRIDAASISFEVVPQAALDYLKDYAIRSVALVTETQKETAKAAIAQGLEEGLSTEQAVKRLREQLPELSKAKAEQIVRTESSNAYSQGQIQSYREVGAKKRWMLAPDACTLCKAIAAKFNAPLDPDATLFNAGDSITDEAGVAHTFKRAVTAPPGHPHCRCAIAPSFD